MKSISLQDIGQKATLCLLLSIMLCACSHREKHYVIGVSQCSEDIWRDKLNEELRIASFAHDNVEVRFASAGDNDQRQIEQIDKFIDDGVNLLIASPNQMYAISSAINRAYDKGIPVILFDRKTNSHKYTAFIGADNREIGRVMGEYVGSALKGKGNVLEITGLPSSSPAIERHLGFCDALKAYPGIKLIDSIHGDWTEKSGLAAMNKALREGYDIDCVFGQNDRMAMGARRAAMKQGEKKGIVYVGVDGLPTPEGGLQCVLKREMDASYIYPTRGDLVIQLAMNILKGKPFKKDNKLKATIVTRDNARAMLMQVDEMNYQHNKLIELHDKVNLSLAQYNHQQVYLLLSIIIILLLIALFAYIYRTIAIKRHLEEEAIKAKLQFFTNVSHEFRTPLTLIADPIERLLDNCNPSEGQHSLLLVVQKNVKVMLRLIGEILDFSKIQSGKMTVNITTFDLAVTLREWIEGFEPVARTKKIDLTTDLPQSLIVSTDHDKMERICYNLLSNALKYTPNGGKIKVSLDSDDEKMTFSVEDNGVGIPKDSVQHIFERFYQVRHTNVGGTGIGLALVSTYSALLGGGVSVKSREGQGSTFVVTMPLAVPTHNDSREVTVATRSGEAFPIAGETMSIEAEDSSLERITSPASDTVKAKILIVDDNDDARSYIATLLKPHYEVGYATNGQDGLDKALKEVPDLIISDVMMPVMDGLEFCEQVKKATVTSHIPIILLTGRSQEGQRAEGYDYGADAYITKPFHSRVLLARVNNLLTNRHRLRDVFSNGSLGEDKPEDSDTHFINDFRKQVQTMMADPNMSVESLSAKMGMSRVQLYRKVKALTGASPVELISITRLKRAEQLLKLGGKTVAEVSYQVGFSSPSYFSKCFKAYFGLLPGDVK